ncbi:MAG: OmpA family protein [Bacteroidetes bacterium]|nr:OmpA family protein [Bacteroidota bacterium]
MKRSLYLFVFSLISLASDAQYQIGQSISNYSGTNNLYFNASNVVDGRYRFYMTLSQTSLHFSNDYITYNGGYHPFGALFHGVPVMQSIWKVPPQYIDNNGSVIFKDSWLTENLNGKPKNAFVQAEQRLFSFQFNVSPKTAFAVTNRTRVMFQFTNVSEPLARMMRYGFDTSTAPFKNGELSVDKLYSNNSFNINLFAFNETGVTWGQVLMDKDKNFLKMGVTGKYYVPIYGMYIRNDAIDVTLYGDDSLAFNNADIEYGYISDSYYTNASSSRNPLKLGKGFGMDIGFTYEYRPDIKKYRYMMDGKERTDATKNKYKLRIQAALNDLGAVTVQNQGYARAYKLAPAATIAIDKSILDTMKVLQDRYASQYGQLVIVDSLVGRTAGFKTVSDKFVWKLPANLNLNVDYNVYKKFYINALWIQSLRGKQVNGIRGFSLLSFTPRYEGKWFEASMPLQLTQNYKKFRMGIYLRGGPFWIGSDNFGSLFQKKGITGSDIYIGVSLPLYKKKPKDRDHDHVSDKKDKCKNIPGVWEFKGCPDTDGDGIQDKEDSCVDVPGVMALHGCPDRDEDGIADSKDECPDVPGLAAFNGCPDTDGDGLIDKLDSCPEIPGPIEQNGCPDRDGDGIFDDKDTCIDTPGLPEFNGCPDRDKDQVPDYQDKCPDVPGIKVLFGCPDADGDGVYDAIDLCPLQPGLKENNGCPKVEEEQVELVEIPEEDQTVLNEAFANLEFALGSAVIDPSSYESLNKLAELMNKKPEYKIYISGHTDNTGNAKKNQKLSEDRANAVRVYLQNKGISPGRIKTEGFGADRPVADNSTPEGRQKNRRVEFRIIK